ncbi:MAG: FAD-dependent monooxygenase [Firmicutes bacterium]|nr:FAD-dependent monooxygenase [Bacillota bacterium]
MYDIAVIGLGPAGAFFVRHLNEKYRVIAIDKKAPQGKSGFCKPCGGLLAPDAQRSLSRFNITLPKDILVNPQIFSVRTIDVKQNLIRHYQRHYINLDRHKFDLWLISKIPDHVEVHSDAVCTNITPQEEGYQVTYTQNGESRTIEAKYLVGADGAASIVRRTVYKDFKKTANPSKRDTQAFGLLEKIPGVKRGEGGVVCMYNKLLALQGRDMVIPAAYL